MGFMEKMRSQVTNQRVAEDLGITHSAVSRIRSGDRLPSFELMVKIAEAIGWEVVDQHDARLLDSYPQAFEEALAENYDE